MNGQCALSEKFIPQEQITPSENKRMASGYDGHISKRQRTDNSDRDDDRINPAPSPVVHVRGLTDLVTEGDLMRAVQHFGMVSYVMMMSRKHQALIEFENITGARSCVEFAQHNQIFVGDHPAFFNYSTSAKIQRPSGEGDMKAANHILLYTVLNPQYPITVDVMHTINSPYGQVQRIVIFKKNGVQAMVEFESIDSAKRAKQNLNGADIYSGCCTLKIEFAKPTRLNVVRNDQDSWDYTNPNLGKEPQAQQGRPAPLLQDPRYSNIPTPYEQKMNSGYGGQPPQGGSGGGGSGYQGQSGYNGPPQQGYGSPQGGYSPSGGGGYGMYDQGDGYGGGGYPPSSSRQYDMGPQDRYPPSKPPMQHVPMQQDRGYGRGPPQNYPDSAPPMGGPPPGGAMIQGSVLMVYGLNLERVNCDKLFNLFCLYGNVVRIKFLKSKEGSAMVQMGDSLALERCMQNLNYCHFFGSKVQLGHSKQAFLQDVPNPHDLPDGSPSFKDFMGSRNNRFANPEAAAKNRIMTPTKTLHYFNAPPTLSKEEIEEMFDKCGAGKPSKIKQFQTKNERSSTGLLQFDSKGDALEALISVNHYSLPNPSGKNPYIFKVCFSGTTVDRD